MKLKMKLWITYRQCRVRWSDNDHSKDLFRETSPSHFTNDEIFQLLSSQLGEWTSKKFYQDHSLQCLIQSFEFSVAQRDDQEVSANVRSATVNQVDTVLAYFSMKEADLNFSTDDEEPTIIERRTELYSMMFELLKNTMVSLPSADRLAQISLRWLASPRAYWSDLYQRKAPQPSRKLDWTFS